MLENLINIEIEKFRQNGYEAVVSNEFIDVKSKIHIETIGNCIYILTGVIFPNYDTLDFSTTKISMYSPVGCLNKTQRIIAAISNEIFVKFKNFIVFKYKTNENIELIDRTDGDENGSTLAEIKRMHALGAIPEIKFKFVKITPYKKN